MAYVVKWKADGMYLVHAEGVGGDWSHTQARARRFPSVISLMRHLDKHRGWSWLDDIKIVRLVPRKAA